MKRELNNPLTNAALLLTPVVVPTMTWEQYLSVLIEVSIKHSKKHQFSFNTFQRWVKAKYQINQPAIINESLIEQLRNELINGHIIGANGDILDPKLASQIPGNIFNIHNAAADLQTPGILRRLIDCRLVKRLSYFNSLTEQSRQAIVWFEREGRRTSSKYTRPPQVMTTYTRSQAINAAFQLMKELGVHGLEQITADMVANFTPPPDPDDKEYRCVARLIHTVSSIYRSCIQSGYLHSNPLTNVDNRIFSANARRDFLPPDQIDLARNLDTVDFKNWRRVRDRVVVLVLIDLSLRKNELAGVELTQVKHTADGAFQINLLSENQKMTGKSVAPLDILYPETIQLLKHYLKNVRPQFGGNSLIVNHFGRAASHGAIAGAVKREGIRLGLKCYFSGKPPGCHTLRRSFPTCNAAPLGLSFGLVELADRLRCGVEVAKKHYIVENPLRRSAIGEEYRRRFKAEDPDKEALVHISALEKSNSVDSNLLAILRTSVEQRIQAKTTPDMVVKPHVPVWINEEEMISLLYSRWNHLPQLRDFRPYIKAMKGIIKSKPYGRTLYDKVLIEDIVGAYVPIADLLVPSEKMPRNVLEKVRVIKIGGLKLISAQDGIQLAKTLRGGQGNKLANVKTRIPFMQKHANRSFIMSETGDTAIILPIDSIEDTHESGAGEGSRTPDVQLGKLTFCH